MLEPRETKPRVSAVGDITQYEPAGERRDGMISRKGRLARRRTSTDPGIGLWPTDPAANAGAATLKAHQTSARR